MLRSVYPPRFSDDVVHSLYREGQFRRIPMTRLADDLLRQSFRAMAVNTLAVQDSIPAAASIRSPA
jgi:hypothetical protein